MACASVRSIIPSLKLGDYLSVQAHKPCSIYHLFSNLPAKDKATGQIRHFARIISQSTIIFDRDL